MSKRVSRADGVSGSNSPVPASPSGEWSDEQHHVAPEGAQRHWYSTTVAEFMAALDEMVAHIDRADLIAARYHANRQDRIAERCDAAEHDPGTPEAWADGCDCPRPSKRGEFDVNPLCQMHAGGE